MKGRKRRMKRKEDGKGDRRKNYIKLHRNPDHTDPGV